MSRTIYEGFTRTDAGARWKVIRMCSKAWNEKGVASDGSIARVKTIGGKHPTILSGRRHYWTVKENPTAGEEFATAIALRPALLDPHTYEEQLKARTGLDHKVTFHRRRKISLFMDIRSFLGM